MQANRRKNVRYKVAVTAELELADETWTAETRDISAGGVSLILDREIKEGEKISVTLILTQDGIEDAREEPFQATAEVMWTAPTDAGPWIAGFRWNELGQAQTRQLERFLKAAQPAEEKTD